MSHTPPDARAPLFPHTREKSGLRLDAHLAWWHDGERIEHPKIVEAFNRGLKPTGDGRFRLDFGGDWCFVEVDGPAAYRVTAVEVMEHSDASARPKLAVWLSDRSAEEVALDALSLWAPPEATAEQRLCCTVKGGLAQALFSRDAQFELGSRLEPVEALMPSAPDEGERWALRCGGQLYPLTLRVLD